MATNHLHAVPDDDADRGDIPADQGEFLKPESWLVDFTGVLDHPDVLKASDLDPAEVDIDPEIEARLQARFALIGEKLEQMLLDDEPDRELTREEVIEMSGGDDPVRAYEEREARLRCEQMRLVPPPEDDPDKPTDSDSLER